MNRNALLGALLLALTCFGFSHAGKYNKVLDIGDAAPTWKDLEGVDGKKHASESLQGKAAVVVVFTCNSCPYAADVEQRLIALTKEFKNRNVAVVAINANQIPADNLAAMKARALNRGFNFPYLHDSSQQVAKAFGAFYTPEFFVLNKDWKVAYMGSLDNSPNGKSVTVRHVAEALEQTLSGKPVAIQETVPIGCKIRYERKRRKR